ncbi:MAG: hypothetical protein R3C16_10785 [Hyphomonadaceae bacterium]
MSLSEGPNPERRSTGAIICFGAGAALTTLAWFFGIGGVLATVGSGGDPAMMAGGIGMLLALGLCTVLGVVLLLVGGVWMLAQVIADQRGEPK